MKMRHVYPWKIRFAHDGSKIQCKKCAHHMGQKSFREPSGVVFLGYRVNFTVFDGSYTMGASQWVNMQWVCIAEQHPSKVNPVYRLMVYQHIDMVY